MICDVRQCPEDEIRPLIKKMTLKSPVDVIWHSSNGIGFTAIYKLKGHKLSIRRNTNGDVWFEFYTGVDNIRFDGRIQHRDDVQHIISQTKNGSGMKVSDFIKI